MILEESPILSGRGRLGTEYRALLNDRVALQIERFEGYFAACWQSRFSLLQFISSVRDMGVPGDAETWLVVPHLPRTDDYVLTTLDESRTFPEAAASFARVDGADVGLTWQLDESSGSRVVGFIGGLDKKAPLDFLFAKSAEFPSKEALDLIFARMHHLEE